MEAVEAADIRSEVGARDLGSGRTDGHLQHKPSAAHGRGLAYLEARAGNNLH